MWVRARNNKSNKPREKAAMKRIRKVSKENALQFEMNTFHTHCEMILWKERNWASEWVSVCIDTIWTRLIYSFSLIWCSLHSFFARVLHFIYSNFTLLHFLLLFCFAHWIIAARAVTALLFSTVTSLMCHITFVALLLLHLENQIHLHAVLFGVRGRRKLKTLHAYRIQMYELFVQIRTIFFSHHSKHIHSAMCTMYNFTCIYMTPSVFERHWTSENYE